MDKTVARLINDQITKEFYSAYLYLDIANYYSAKGLDGFANWYMIQAKEEEDHAMLFYQYMHNCGETVTLKAIAKPDKKFTTDPMSPLKVGLEHEKYVTSLINKIYAAADKVNDYQTMGVLDWFVQEQGEEEKNASDLISQMKQFGGEASGLYLLNKELGSRSYSAPSLDLD